MKKSLFTLLAAAFMVISAWAAPVSQQQAQKLSLSFARENLSSARQITSVEHVFTLSLDKGTPCLYVFDYDNGFIIVAADDVAKPILGYSEEGRFDIDNIPDGLSYYLDHYKGQMAFAIENDIPADSQIRQEWEWVRRDGTIDGSRGTKGVNALIATMWNQDYPYNYYCPTHNFGPGGHVYAGCVADAMAMVMKYWDYPETGTGSHSYTPNGYPTQSVNFGETAYDWSNMPNNLSSSSPMAQIQAVALLIYHCGVAVDMGYAPDGSGAFSNDVPGAMSDYFRYTKEMSHLYRNNYSKTEWEDMLIANFDRGFPAYYSGQDINLGGHAFVCDGYNDNRYFHFNWGWSGMGNGFFAIDALNAPGYHFNYGQSAIFDMIPDHVYNGLPALPESFEVVPENAQSLKATVSWKNPSTTQSNAPLENLAKVVVLRNGAVIHEENDVAPGENMSFVDEVPEYDYYSYEIYAVSDKGKGRRTSTATQFGPSCRWRLLGTTTNFQGWNDGAVCVHNAKGTVIAEFTLTSSGNGTQYVDMPEGEVSLTWKAPTTPVASLTIILKDEGNETVYTYTGSSTGLNGTLFTKDNQCSSCQSPENLSGHYHWQGDAFGTQLTWSAAAGETEKYYVYRGTGLNDMEKIAEVDGSELTYFDEVEVGSYYYRLTAKHSYCESQYAMNADQQTDYALIEVTSTAETSASKIDLYPNPAHHVLYVHAEGVEQIDVFNIMGQRVLSQQSQTDDNKLNINGFSPGVYTVRVKTGQGMFSRRFTVMQ